MKTIFENARKQIKQGFIKEWPNGIGFDVQGNFHGANVFAVNGLLICDLSAELSPRECSELGIPENGIISETL